MRTKDQGDGLAPERLMKAAKLLVFKTWRHILSRYSVTELIVELPALCCIFF
jgi:hypothetical protein